MSARWAALLTALLAILIFAPIIWRMSHSAYDYIVHTDSAVKMFTTGTLSSPHFLFQAGIITLRQLFPISFQSATVLVVLFSIAATAALLFKIMQTATKTIWMAGILTICLLLVAPLPLLAPLDGQLYFGYIASNVYHNPTILLLKPFSLLVFAYIVSQSATDEANEWKSLTVCILATIACGLAKPSYLIVMVPALVIAFTLPGLRKALAGRVWLIAYGILLPALIVLAGQYWLTYSAEQIQGVYQGKSSIIFAPLTVMSTVSSWLLVKFLLSLSFPLAVGVSYYRQVLAYPRLLFAWLAFLLGAGYTYLFAESGPRMYQGNFIWSSQITLFLLFVVSTEFFFEEIRCNGLKDRYRKLVFIACFTLFILHTLSGINFYLAQYIAGDYCN